MKITVITQAYNSKNYIRRSVESVLNQSHRDFEYILYDNGSTDGTREILEEYARRDGRIKLLRREENYRGVKWCDILLQEGTGEYFTELDSDDWLEPDYLEQLAALAEAGQYDIVSTGTLFHWEGSDKRAMRKIDQRMSIEKKDFGRCYPLWYGFFLVYWGKLIRMSVFRKTELVKNLQRTGLRSQCIDCVICLALLRNSNRICLDNSILHHYIYHSTSLSFQYDPLQFNGVVYLLKDYIDFLFPYGPVSQINMTLIFQIYANQVLETANNVHTTSILDEKEKMSEYKRILTHEITQIVFRYSDEQILQRKIDVFQRMLFNACHITGTSNADFEAIKDIWFPYCGKVLTLENAGLFLKE